MLLLPAPWLNKRLEVNFLEYLCLKRKISIWCTRHIGSSLKHPFKAQIIGVLIICIVSDPFLSSQSGSQSNAKYYVAHNREATLKLSSSVKIRKKSKERRGRKKQILPKNLSTEMHRKVYQEIKIGSLQSYVNCCSINMLLVSKDLLIIKLVLCLLAYC